VRIAGGAAAKGQLDDVGVEAGGQYFVESGHQFRGQVDIVNLPGGFVVKMGVFVEIRAVAGRSALEIYLPDDATLN
jgi:hypothetical protein